MFNLDQKEDENANHLVDVIRDNNHTLASFMRTFQKELNYYPHIKESYEFGKIVVNLASQLEDWDEIRVLLSHLVSRSLKITSNIYKAHNVILENCGTEEAVNIAAQCLDEIKKCRELLRELSLRIGRVVILSKIIEQQKRLEMIIRIWIDQIRVGEA